MSTTLSKKLLGTALTITTFAWMGGAFLLPVANAQSAADLQAQIAALLAQIQALQAQLGAAQGSGTAVQCNFSRNLTVGSTGDDVKCLQQYLNGAGFQVAASGAGSPGNESSYFGSLTRGAAIKWQDAYAAQVLAPVGLSAGTGFWGPSSRSYYNQLAAGGYVPPTTPGQPAPLPGGFSLSLASDNPAGQAVPKAASGVTLLKFVVSGSGTLNNIVFKRAGIGATGDFNSSGLYVYEGANRLTSGKTLNSTTHEVSFVGLNLAVSGSRTLSLVGDIAGGATTGNRSYFELVSATGDPAPSGSLRGNLFEIAGQIVGGLDPASGAAPANPKIGQKAAKLAEFRLTASSTEDVLVYRLSLTEGGSVTNSKLSNFVLKQAGNTVATADAVGAKDLVTFTLTSPFKVEKGQQKTFEVYGDIAGDTRANDTIVFYFDSKTDIYALGSTYGYPVLPTIDALDSTSDGDTLTIQGGDVTIAFNGPIAGDLPLRGQDVTIFDFSISSQNNIEIKNLPFRTTTTGWNTNDGYNDFKVWDVDAAAVITSAVDITATSTATTFTDTININAGQSKHFKVTVDIDADNDAGDTILTALLAFSLGDIKNLDNNTNVALASIVPSAAVVGNTHSVVAPGLDIQLSATPSSQTYVQGSTDVALVGFSFRATADNIRIDQIVVSSTASTGTLGAGEIQSFALYDGSTRVSDLKSLDSSTLNITFSNMNYTVPKGQTKVLTLRGNIATDASNNDVYYFLLNATTDVTAYDTEGNSVTNTGITANSGGTVTVTIATVGDVTVVVAPSDSESQAGIVVAGTETVLGKYRVTSANESMTINKLHILISSSTTATATSTVPLADDVPQVKLYEGTTLIGGPYTVLASGASSGIAIVQDLGWVVPKNTTKTLTVKGVLNSIAAGADAGTQIYAHVQATGFEAQGSTAKDNAITAATGNQKVLYKTKPFISLGSAPTNKLANGLKEVLRFKVKADGPEAISFKKLQFKVSMTGATMSNASTTTSNVTIKKTNDVSNLTLASAFSATTTAGTEAQSSPIIGANTGFVTLILSSEQSIDAGSEAEYTVSLTFADVSTAVGAASADVKLAREETSLAAATTYNGIETATLDGAPSFIWSDYSATGHSETTLDWVNGVYVTGLPTAGNVISNN